MTPPLVCPVRGCGLLLQKNARAWTCERGHTFDIARSGYVNLLQPQDRRSPNAGDARESVLARGRLLDHGVGAQIVEAFVTRAAVLVEREALIVELGCGSGDTIGRLHARTGAEACGLDLSAFAVDRAARRFPDVTWIVANADRRLPFPDASVSLVLSLHARRNPSECARVLKTGGHLLLGVPAPQDLVELRELVQGKRVERDRVNDTLVEHATGFHLVEHSQEQERHRLGPDALRDLLRGTYRGERSNEANRAEALDDMQVTIASDIVLLQRR